MEIEKKLCYNKVKNGTRKGKTHMSAFSQDILELLRLDYGTSPEQATTVQLYDAVSRAAMAQARGRWRTPAQGKRACYFSAEFLMGRMISANLYNLSLIHISFGQRRRETRISIKMCRGQLTF